MTTSNTTYISDLNFDTHNWSIRVTVLHKYSAAYGRESNSLSQKILLTNDNGTLVEAMIYGTTVNYFAPILREGRKYIITNAHLRAQQSNRISSLLTLPFYWVLYASTPVEPVDGHSTDIHTYNPHFATAAAELSASRDTNQQINYLGIVVGHRPPRSVGGNTATIQEYYVIDHRLGKQFHGHHVEQFECCGAPSSCSIFILHFDLQSHYVCHLCLQEIPSFYSTHSEAFTSLQDWRSSHMVEIDALINSGDLYRVIHASPSANNNVYETIANVLEAGRSPSAPMVVRARLDDDFQNHQYICCSDCNRSTSAVAGSTFYCDHCSRSRTAIVRFKMNVIFYDNTKEIPITVFGSDAENLIGQPPYHSIQTIQPIAAALRAKFRTQSIRATINLRTFNNRPSYTVSQYPASTTPSEATESENAQSSAHAEGTSFATNVAGAVQHSRIAGFPIRNEDPSTPPAENVDEHEIIEHPSSDNGPPITPAKCPRATPPE